MLLFLRECSSLGLRWGWGHEDEAGDVPVSSVGPVDTLQREVRFLTFCLDLLEEGLVLISDRVHSPHPPTPTPPLRLSS